MKYLEFTMSLFSAVLKLMERAVLKLMERALLCLTNCYPTMVAGSTSVGNPYGAPMRLYFFLHNFENRREDFKTGSIEAHDHYWNLKVRYWGNTVEMFLCLDHQHQHQSSSASGLALACASTGPAPFPLYARFRTLVRAAAANAGEHHCHTFRAVDEMAVCLSHTLRDDLLECCDGAGTLTIEVDVETAPETTTHEATATATTGKAWYPRLDPRTRNRNDSDNDEDSDLGGSLRLFPLKHPPDVCFVVGPSKKEFWTHKQVLKTRAGLLHELVLADDDIKLPSEDESAFEAVIDFIYTGNKPRLDNSSNNINIDNSNSNNNAAAAAAAAANLELEFAESVLVMSDRFGCTDLKLFCESVLADKCLVPHTAARLMVLADSHSCALLKEAAMELYALCPHAVVMAGNNHNNNNNSSSSCSNSSCSNSCGKDWALVEDSPRLLSELLRYTNIDRRQRSWRTVAASAFPECMTVASLRRGLERSNLDVDGSREMLVERWREHHNKGMATSY